MDECCEERQEWSHEDGWGVHADFLKGHHHQRVEERDI
jgi:hypothetical protein